MEVVGIQIWMISVTNVSTVFSSNLSQQSRSKSVDGFASMKWSDKACHGSVLMHDFGWDARGVLWRNHHNEVLRRRKFSLPNFSKTFSTISRCTFLEFERKLGEVPRIFLHDRGIKIQNYRHTQTNPNLRKTTVVSGMPAALEWRGVARMVASPILATRLLVCWLLAGWKKAGANLCGWICLAYSVVQHSYLVPATTKKIEDLLISDYGSRHS